MANIILITGGQRSGKSSYAQNLALNLANNPIYWATSRIWDDEHAKRIERHKKDRDHRWTNTEADKSIANFDIEGRVVLMDCITLWLTNYFFDNNSDIDKALEEAKKEFAKLVNSNCTLIAVTNEIGMGGIPIDPIQRKFTDLQGWFNQHVANQANQVFLMVSGISVQIK